MTVIDTDRQVDRLHATTPFPLPFAPSLHARAFLLERDAGNLLLYSTGALDSDVADLEARGGVERQYLNHWHELLFGLAPESLGARLVHHEAETDQVRKRGGHGVTFSRRFTLDGDFEAIPIPGHTPGATAYLWDNGEERLLFSGDSVFIEDGEWIGALLESSDRDAYLASLALLRDLDFDVLVPWATTGAGPYLHRVGPAERRDRINAIIDRIEKGADR